MRSLSIALSRTDAHARLACSSAWAQRDDIWSRRHATFSQSSGSTRHKRRSFVRSAIDFKTWSGENFGDNTPWGEVDSSALTSVVETALERLQVHHQREDG